jgi:hypothetical protein
MSSARTLGAKVPGDVRIGHELLERRLLQDLEHVDLRVIDDVLAKGVIITKSRVVDDLRGS